MSDVERAIERLREAFSDMLEQVEQLLADPVDEKWGDKRTVEVRKVTRLEERLARSGISTRAETDHLLNRQVGNALNVAAGKKLKKLYAHGDTCE